MTSSESERSRYAATRQYGRRAGIAAVAIAVSSAIALELAAFQDVPWQQAAFLPLLVLGAILAARSTHSALCYAAFSITPFGIVQQEVLGVTLNLPEVLILALAVKEAVSAAARWYSLPDAFPRRSVALYLCATVAAVFTGLLHHNGTVRVLQDFRQFTEFLVLFWLVLRHVSGRDDALRIATCYVLGASFIAAHGIVQQIVPLGIGQTQLLSDLDLYRGVRSSSFYGATTLGGLMVLAVAPALGVALSAQRRGLRLLMALCVLLCVLALVFTRTRGSWLGLAVALMLIAISIRPSARQLASAVAAGFVILLALGPLVVQRLYTLTDPEQDLSLMARAQYYAVAAHIGRAHPLAGLGWGCYYDIDAILAAERYVETPLDETRAAALTVEDATVHSAYLQLLVKSGILGRGAWSKGRRRCGPLSPACGGPGAAPDPNKPVRGSPGLGLRQDLSGA